MAKIIQFPSITERNWMHWKESIEQSYADVGIDARIIAHAMPRMKDHWVAVFEPTDLELPKRAVPGKLTANQAAVIQSIINDAAELVIERLQKERISAFQRLLDAEVEISTLHLAQEGSAE